MLAAVGCKDYDDDIDKINNRVDGLEGQITALNDVDSRLKVVEGVCDKFKNFDPNKDYAVKQDITVNSMLLKLNGWQRLRPKVI